MVKRSIILLVKGDCYELWGSLTELCAYHSRFNYGYLKGKSFPFRYKGVWFEKVPYRALNGV